MSQSHEYNPEHGPADELDVMADAIRSSMNDEDLEGAQLGLGNYDKREYWQQIQSYRDGMYAQAAFGRSVAETARREAVVTLGEDGWSYYDEDRGNDRQFEGWADLDAEERAEKHRREWIERRGEEIWDQLTERQRERAVRELTGTDLLDGWLSPFFRMLLMRHEASRSIDARLLDDVFGRVDEFRGEIVDGDEDALQRLRNMGGSR